MVSQFDYERLKAQLPRRARIALAGCGGIASGYHLPTLAHLKDVTELVAVSDRDEERALSRGAKYDVPAYTSAEEMLDRHPDVDILFVLTPPYNHHEVGEMAASRGLHLLIEKPLAITLPAADRLLVACESHGVFCEVAENFPLMPMDQMVSLLVEKGTVGDVRRAHVVDRINSFNVDITIHRMSQLLEVVPDIPACVQGLTQYVPLPAGLPEPEDRRNPFDPLMHHRGLGIIQFAGGALGSIECLPTWRYPEEGQVDCRQVVGTEGMILDDLWPNYHPQRQMGFFSLRMGRGESLEEVPVTREMGSVNGFQVLQRIIAHTQPPIVWENPFKGLPLSDWQIACATEEISIIRSALLGEPPLYGQRGRRDLEVWVAIGESDRQGCVPLALPLTEETEFEKRVAEDYNRWAGYEMVPVQTAPVVA